MPKRDIEEFIAHWSGATAPEQAISQQFLCDLCDLLDVPPPGNQRNGGYTFEFHVRETQHDGSTREGRIDLYKRACFVLESKKFPEARPEPSQLELSAVEIGATARSRKSAGPVRDTDRWDDAMLNHSHLSQMRFDHAFANCPDRSECRGTVLGLPKLSPLPVSGASYCVTLNFYEIRLC